MPLRLLLSIVFAIALTLGGCSGGSGTDGVIAPEDDSGDPLEIGDGDGSNGPLSGRLVIDRRLFDFATGQFSDELAPRALRGSRVLSAAPDGRMLYYIREGCRDRPDRGFLQYDCVVVLDPAGTEIGLLDPGLDLSTNPPNVSPDGRFVAVDSTEIHGFQRIVILGPDGQIVDDGDRTSTTSRMDWGPDGTLYYLADDAVFQATVGDDPADDRRVHRFDDAEGFPAAMSVSPDGLRIAIELSTGESATEQASSVWLMNADGGELRQFVTVSAGSQPTVRNPIWSPDGRRLLVNAGGFSLFTGRPTPTSPDFGGGLFALDTSVTSHAIDTFASADADAQILVRFACDDPDGCEFGVERGVTGWVP